MNDRGVILLVVAALVGHVEVHSAGRDYLLGPGQSGAFAAEGKVAFQKPSLGGTIAAVSPDGKTLTVEMPAKKGGEAKRLTVKLSGRTRLDYFGVLGDKARPTVGFLTEVWLEEGSEDIAARVRLGLKEVVLTGVVSAVSGDTGFTIQMKAKDGGMLVETEITIAAGAKVAYKEVDRGNRPTTGYFVRVWLKPGTESTATGVVFSGKKGAGDLPGKGVKKGDSPKSNKPEGKKPSTDLPGDKPKGDKKTEKPEAKKPSSDPPGDKPKGDKPSGDKKTDKPEAKKPSSDVPDVKKGDKPVGEKPKSDKPAGDKKTDKPEAKKLSSDPPVDKPRSDKPAGVKKGEKPADKKVEKPAAGKPGSEKPAPQDKKSVEVERPARDPAPIAAAIDAEIDRRLKEEKVPASLSADDAEFLRRVSLDLTGRIPTSSRVIAFLDSKAPDKRRKLIDELLASPAYGQHAATIWRNRIVPRNDAGGKKGRDNFSPWLVERFNKNRGWDGIVRDMLTAEGPTTQTPQSAFVLANGENSKPQPGQLAGTTAQLFWGVQLRCAECHDHPFAQWKQTDFWGTAAFFARLHFTGHKGGTPSLLESDAAGERAAVIAIPASAGKAAGQLVRARFLGGEEPRLADTGALRPAFARWATAADNPFFARAAVNRLWAHFFGRGLTHPVDALDTAEPSHPELLGRLARELADSGFDLKHLARCICNSQAYQRSSRTVPGNEDDQVLVSHMALKVLSAEMLFDSLAVLAPEKGERQLSRPPGVDKTAPPRSSKPVGGAKGKQPIEESPYLSREDFASLFRAQGGGEDATEYGLGIPQMLRLLNGSLLNNGAPIIDQVSDTNVSRDEAITSLFVAALARRPSVGEVKVMLGYLERRKDAREGYRGVLWALLNSSEFAINH